MDQKNKAIDNILDLEQAHRHAVMDDVTELEVTQKCMDKLMKRTGVESITYGHPAVRVFVEGVREKILNEESMSAEDYHTMQIRRNSEAAQRKAK